MIQIIIAGAILYFVMNVIVCLADKEDEE